MILPVRLPLTATYRVEVSGWDVHHNYFVAKANLEWGEDNGKYLTLPQSVSERSIVFVRLVHSTDSSRALPVPYEVEDTGMMVEGAHQLRLHAVEPRRENESGERGSGAAWEARISIFR